MEERSFLKLIHQTNVSFCQRSPLTILVAELLPIDLINFGAFLLYRADSSVIHIMGATWLKFKLHQQSHQVS
jgi:hypothetical protein